MKKNGNNFFGVFTFFLLFNHAYSQTFDWIETIRPGGNEHCWDMVNDRDNNLYVTGRVKSSSTFGSGVYTVNTLPIGLETDVFVAKYRSNGNLVWVKRDGSLQPDWGRAIDVDDFGNVYVTGEYSDTASFGTNQLIAVGTFQNRNIFFAKYDSLGNCLWAKSAGNAAGHSRGYGVVVDSLGNSYVAGHITGPSNFDGLSFGISGKNVPFVAKFSPTGSCLWVKNIQVQYNGEANDIAIGKDGKIIVVGSYKGTLTVNSINYPGNSPSWGDVFIIKMDELGNFIWASTGIGAFQDQANAVDFDSYGNIYVVGTFANDLTLGTTTINSLGGSTSAGTANARADGFIAKYTNSGSFVWVKTIRNSVNGLAYDLFLSSIKVTKRDKLLIGAAAYGTIDLDGIIFSVDTVSETGLLVSLDTLGNVIWYKNTAGINNTHFNIRAVGSDNFNNYYVAGGFTGNPYISFDSITVQSYNGYDGIIGKITPPLTPFLEADYTIICPGGSINYSVIQDGFPLSYQWSFSGGVPSSSSIENPTVNYLSSGTFLTKLIIGNGHQIDSTTINILVTPTACTLIENTFSDTQINIFPNPTSSILTLDIKNLPTGEKIKLEIYNNRGELVEYNNMYRIETRIVINIENLISGQYFYKLSSNNNELIKIGKIIVIKK